MADERPYFWLFQTQEGEWQFIPLNEEQLKLLSLLGLDLVKVSILPPSYTPKEAK